MTLRASLLVCLVATASSVSTRAQDLPPEVVAKIRAVGQARFVDKTLQQAFIDSQIDSYRGLMAYAPEGIPRDRLDMVKAQLDARYPTDYWVQRQHLDLEVDGYRFLDRYHPDGISPTDLDLLLERARKLANDSYSMQRTLLVGQVESCQALMAYAPDGLPPDVLADIKKRIARKYPLDCLTQRRLVENEVRGYFERPQQNHQSR